jgi:fructose-bisphosphate aldolase class I
VAPGKGILAADESTGTIGSRLAEIKLENNKQNRREYRKLLFTTKDLAKHISGVILFEETLFDKTEDGKDLVQPLRDQGIILGIKVDQGTKHLPGTDDVHLLTHIVLLIISCAENFANFFWPKILCF